MKTTCSNQVVAKNLINLWTDACKLGLTIEQLKVPIFDVLTTSNDKRALF